jgi:hypothetical protein
VGELVTLHVDDTPTLGATWLFESGDDVTIALVLGWDDSHWFFRDVEGAWKVPRSAWFPRTRFARVTNQSAADRRPRLVAYIRRLRRQTGERFNDRDWPPSDPTPAPLLP